MEVGASSRSFRPEEFGIGRLFQHMRDAVIVANARTEQIVLWNDCAATLFGYSVEEATGVPLHSLVPENLRQLHRTGIARFQDTGGGNLIESGSPVELLGLHKNGDEIPIELTLTKIPETTADGDRFALAIVRDISERKRAEQARLELRELEVQRRDALRLNEAIVQGLVVAKMALESGDADLSQRTLERTLQQAKAMVSTLIEAVEEGGGAVRPGQLVQDAPPSADAPPPPPP